MKKILIISALHGNETFSVNVLDSLTRKLATEKHNYKWIIGNPRAAKLHTRFTQSDLNRVAPGNKDSNTYEEKRAAELIEMSKKHSLILDIHGTDAKTGIFTLITNPTIENFLLSAVLPISKVVIWAAKISIKTGPVTQFTHCPAVEIECGPKSSPIVSKQLYSSLSKFIQNPNPGLVEILGNLKRQKHFVVFGKGENLDTSKLSEFKQVKFNNESFYPLLINSYQEGSVRKMKPMNLFDSLSY